MERQGDKLEAEMDRLEKDAAYAAYVNEKRKRERRFKIVTLSVIFVTCVIALLTTLADLPSSSLDWSRIFKPFQLATLAILVLGFSVAVLGYLKPAVGKDERGNGLIYPADTGITLEELVFQALQRINKVQPVNQSLDETDRNKIVAAITAKMEAETIQSYVADLKASFRVQAKQDVNEEQFQFMRTRMMQQLEDLARRGNLNLLLGVLTTILGLGVITYTVFATDGSTVDSLPKVLTHFIPRISLAVLIEVLAYFFLKLYKQSLLEIKYFHNEITNMEAKHLALGVAMYDELPGGREKVVAELLGTERNFILEKGQTTVELEREKISSKDVESLLKLSRRLSANKSGK